MLGDVNKNLILRTIVFVLTGTTSLTGLPHSSMPTLKQKYFEYAKELRPSIKPSLASRLAFYTEMFCDPETGFDLIRIGFLESSLRDSLQSKTEDYGMFQINVVHGLVGQGHLAEQVAWACARIKWAKSRGSIGYYHSKTKKYRQAYMDRYNKLKETK